jgi:hypothetical protein
MTIHGAYLIDNTLKMSVHVLIDTYVQKTLFPSQDYCSSAMRPRYGYTHCFACVNIVQIHAYIESQNYQCYKGNTYVLIDALGIVLLYRIHDAILSNHRFDIVYNTRI